MVAQALPAAFLFFLLIPLLLRPWSDRLGDDVRAGNVESLSAVPVMSTRTGRYGTDHYVTFGERRFLVDEPTWATIDPSRTMRAFFLPRSSTLLGFEGPDVVAGEPIRLGASVGPGMPTNAEIWLIAAGPIGAAFAALAIAFPYQRGQEWVPVVALVYLLGWLALAVLPLQRLPIQAARWVGLSARLVLVVFVVSFPSAIALATLAGGLGPVSSTLTAAEATWCAGHWPVVRDEASGALFITWTIDGPPDPADKDYIRACQQAAEHGAAIPVTRSDVPLTTFLGGAEAAAGLLVLATASLVRRRQAGASPA
ncbi:MAG: hypothetical protein ACHQ15_06165 [Candidatus Limnocylindrales bacterium]